MKLTRIKKLIALTIILCKLSLLPAQALPIIWQTVAPGIEYTKLGVKTNLFGGYIHAFKIDLHKNQLRLAFGKEIQLNTATIQQFVQTNQALIGINGGFFTSSANSLGLRIRNGLVLNPLKSISWWGVFYITGEQAHIVASNQFNNKKSISFAIQSGPRLIINKKIVNLKPGIDERSALGITTDGKIIILATDNAPLTTQQLAELMIASNQVGGFDCVNAINLDGGSSTQLFAQIQNFRIDVPSYKTVADAILVYPR